MQIEYALPRGEGNEQETPLNCLEWHHIHTRKAKEKILLPKFEINLIKSSFPPTVDSGQ